MKCAILFIYLISDIRYCFFIELHFFMNQGQATLKELAKRLNLSISTISRALRDHPDINEVTKLKVVELARELDYQPNQLALNLLKKRSNYIAVIVPKLSYHLYAQAISGIEAFAEEQGFSIMICQTNESYEREVNYIREFNAIRVAGYIISLASNTRDFSHFQQLVSKEIPVVFFNRDCEDVPASKVVIDNYKAAFEAVEHLKDQGFRRLAFMAGPKHVQISNKRLKGFVDALEQYGLEYNERYILHSDFSQESAIAAARKMIHLPEPPDAILTFSDQMAIGAMLAIKEAGLKVPNDIAVMGFNNEPVDNLIEPSLTSIDQPAYEMGWHAAEMLFDQINGQTGEQVLKVLRSEIVIRNSTSKYARK